MNPDVSRRAARALQNCAVPPRERLRLAGAVEKADSWESLPDDVRAQLEAAERSTDTQEQVGEQLLRRTAAAEVSDRLG